MPGDTIKVDVYAKYLDPNTANWTTALNTLITGIAGGTAPAGTVIDGTGYATAGSIPLPVPPIGHGGSGGAVPKAYVNYIYINRDFDPASVRIKYTRITEAAKESGADGAHEHLTLVDTVREAGYVYVYLSNDNESVTEVYFDDFEVEHIKSPVVQMDDYYPFGLTFNSYSRENSVTNRYLYNQGAGEKTFKTERVFDLDLNVDQSRDRTYDYITGRWWQVDPKADQGGQDSWSTYHFSFNNPIRYNDPLGDCPECEIEEMTGAIAATLSDGVKGVANIVLAPFGKELSNDADGIALTMQDRQAPQSVGEAILKPAENVLNASSVLPSSGPTSMLLAKTGPAVKNLAADAVGSLNKSLKQQGADIAKANNGNRVTLNAEKIKVEADVAGDAHFSKKTQQSVETPHVKISNRNFRAPNQPAYNTKNVEPVAMTQKEVRVIRKYIESLQKK